MRWKCSWVSSFWLVTHKKEVWIPIGLQKNWYKHPCFLTVFFWFCNFCIVITTATQTATREMKIDWLHKIWPFLDMSREWFRKFYQPSKQLSVDKSLVLFKGQLHFKQYIKPKRCRFWHKAIWVDNLIWNHLRSACLPW